jgi:hypothetical protein
MRQPFPEAFDRDATVIIPLYRRTSLESILVVIAGQARQASDTLSRIDAFHATPIEAGRPQNSQSGDAASAISLIYPAQ